MVKRVEGPGKAAMRATIEQLKSLQVKVGFFEQSVYEDGTPIAYVGAIQELGYAAGGIPARPYLRPALQKGQRGNAVLFGRAIQNGFNGKSVEEGLELLGTKVEGDVKTAIRNVLQPPLQDSTIRARARRHSHGKASSKPLIDTGQMLRAVEGRVVNGRVEE